MQSSAYNLDMLLDTAEQLPNSPVSLEMRLRYMARAIVSSEVEQTDALWLKDRDQMRVSRSVQRVLGGVDSEGLRWLAVTQLWFHSVQGLPRRKCTRLLSKAASM